MKSILIIIILLGLLFILSLPSDAQPRNLQVRITEVKKIDKKRVQCTGVSMQGDSVKIGHRHNHGSMKNCLFIVGSWISVRADFEDEKDCVYYRRRVKANN